MSEQRWGQPARAHGRFVATRTTQERFWEKVDRTGGPESCWLWLGYLEDGYGRFKIAGRCILAHRYAYELLVGPVPEGKQLDHVNARGCTNRHCVNPAHLEPVTNRVNALRGASFAATLAARTHCANGHPYTSENTRLERRKGYTKRVCITCVRHYRQVSAARKGGR